MNITFNGFAENTVTFECDEHVTAGIPVKVAECGKVVPCGEGDKICGVCVNVREGFAAVQLQGYVELSTEGNIPCGFNKIVATADGKVKKSDEGREVLCISSGEGTIGFII